MSNRFQRSAKRIFNGNFGVLNRPFTIVRSGTFNYDTQSADETLFTAEAVRSRLTRSEFESDQVQVGDFALMYTGDVTINLDSDRGIFDGTEVTFVGVRRYAGNACQRIIARQR